MAYEMFWGTGQPGHIVIIIDLSESMGKMIDDVIVAVENICMRIISRCICGSSLRERISVSIYGYNNQIKELLSKTPSSMRDLGMALKEARSLHKHLFDKTKEAKTQGHANYRLAFEKAQNDIEQWIGEQKASGRIEIPSPIVINITDGIISERNDRDFFIAESVKAANDLTSMATIDGNVRLLNVCFEAKSKKEQFKFVKDYPQESNLQFLFNISSPMSEDMVENARSYFDIAEIGSRCAFLSSGGVNAILKLIDGFDLD